MSTCRDERVLPHPPAAVWAALIDLPSWSRWNMATATAPDGLGPGRLLNLSIPLPLGARLPARVKLVAFEPEREIRWRGGPRGLFVGVHGFTLAAEGAGTRLVHEETFSGVLAAPIRRLLGLRDARYAAVNAALDRYLSTLAAPATATR